MSIEPSDMEILRWILSRPTAPFWEEPVACDVMTWAEEQGVAARRDRWGNVVLDWPGVAAPRGAGILPACREGVSPSPIQPVGTTFRDGQSDAGETPASRGACAVGWCLAAHLDHPGFVLRRVRDGVAWAEFLGGVREEFFVGGRVAFFPNSSGVVKGVIRKMHMPPAQGEAQSGTKGGGRGDEVFPVAEIELAGSSSSVLASGVVPPEGVLGMWDFPAMRVRGPVLSSRACDDLVGCAAVLGAMRRIVEVRPAHRVTALLTRAEEVGFVGALAACDAGTVAAGSLVISVEASKAQPGAGLGDGAVVRVGDASRTFDPSVTAMLSATAAELAKADGGFRWSRQLMPGGTCEASAYQARGFRVGGVCLPLANYHNMGPRGRVAPERVHLGDFAAVVQLLTALVQQPPDPSAADRRLEQRLDDIWARHRARL